MDTGLAQQTPWSPGRHVPHKVAILPRGIAIAARKWRFGPLCDLNSCEHGLHTQLGHPITCTALGSHIGSIGWIVSRIPPPVTPPRQREAPPFTPRARRACWVHVGGPRRPRTAP